MSSARRRQIIGLINLSSNPLTALQKTNMSLILTKSSSVLGETEYERNTSNCL